MNRCIINDDVIFETEGVYELQKVTEPMLYSVSPLFKENASQRTHKVAIDGNIFTEALEKTSLRETNSTENHFIIGSTFHTESIHGQQTYNRLDKLLEWLENEMKCHQIRSLYVTVLSGHRMRLVSKELNKTAYYGNWYTFCTLEELLAGPLSSISVNNDFEMAIELIQQGRRLENYIELFLHPKLNSNQLKLMKTKNESFLQSFTNQIRGLTVCQGEN